MIISMQKKMNSGAIKWASHTKQYKELQLESLKFRRWIRRLCTFFEVKTSGKPEYIINLILTGQHSYNTQSLDQMETYYIEIQKLFFPYTTVEWNKLNLDIQNSKSYSIFQNALSKIVNLTNAQLVEFITLWDKNSLLDWDWSWTPQLT